MLELGCLQAVKNVLEQWPQSGLQSAVLVACNFMKSSSSTPVVCESTDKELKTTPFKKVHIPDADFLMVTFDARLVRRSILVIYQRFKDSMCFYSTACATGISILKTLYTCDYNFSMHL